MSRLAAVRRHPHLVALAVVVLIGLWLRAPRIGEGMPYFYHPDEANHFYRTVRMLQTNDYHPYYFLKPTLCFYIRMPAIAGGFLGRRARARLGGSKRSFAATRMIRPAFSGRRRTRASSCGRGRSAPFSAC